MIKKNILFIKNIKLWILIEKHSVIEFNQKVQLKP